MSIASILKGHEFFHNLSMEEVEEVSRFSERRTLERDDRIYTYAQNVVDRPNGATRDRVNGAT